ncbi:aldo/keto reductase [Corynebacterium epidermidicanis]|nr:aldo/keto reductase [Corynebacterium epidermidicanis]
MTSATLIPSVSFRDGSEYPQLGLGTWKLRGEDAIRAVRAAIELGYRHIDTAALYKNEEEVGRAIKEAIAAGDVTRDELCVTTKLWHTDQGADKAADAFQTSLRNLGLDYLDLYLIHWPWPSAGKFVATFEVMAKMQGMGTVQSIGVSNFFPDALDELVAKTGITPAVNQVELHPGFSQESLRAYHEQHGIVTAAWSPLGQGTLLENDTVRDIAQATGKTPAQVILRWHIQLGNMVIPKSQSPERLAENAAIFDFELTADQMAQLTALDNATGLGRIGPDPLEFPDPEGN